MFNDVFSKYKDLLVEDKSIFLIGNPSKREEEVTIPLKFIASQIIPLSEAKQNLVSKLNILLNFEQNNEKTLVKIQTILNDNPGDLNLIVHLESNVGTTKKIQVKSKKINGSSKFLHDLRLEFGESHVWIS